MKYDTVVLDTEELVRLWHDGLGDIGEEDPDDTFTIETINFVLEYIAEQETAKGALSEFITETLEMYGTFSDEKQAAFKSILEAFCFGIYDRVVTADAYLFGTLYATFNSFLGYDIVIRKLTKEEIDAPPINRHCDLRSK